MPFAILLPAIISQNSKTNETASRMGNSPQMIFQHYREMVRPEDAEAFFAIMPPADAAKRANAARERMPRLMQPRPAKISAAILTAVFDGGKLTLTRKDAVAALSARAKTSVAAAYNALALDGRFRANLVETNGKLSWQKIAAEFDSEPLSQPQQQTKKHEHKTNCSVNSSPRNSRHCCASTHGGRGDWPRIALAFFQQRRNAANIRR